MQPKQSILGACLIGASLFACAEPVAPPSGSPSDQLTTDAEIKSNETIFARDDSNFVEKSRVTIRGKKRPDGTCNLTSELIVIKGDSGLSRIAAFNPTTCAFIRADGDWRTPRANLSRSHNATITGLRNPDSTGGKLSASYEGLEFADAYSWQWGDPEGYGMMGVTQSQWTDDPIPIFVTERTYRFQWSWDLYTHGRVDQGSGYASWQWRQGTGWLQPTNGQFTNLTTSNDWWVTGQKHAITFLNPVFCAATSTIVENEASVMGYPDFAQIQWSVTVSGACGVLLTSYHSYHVW